MAGSSPLPLGFPRILVVTNDVELRQLCREGLPWAGCLTEFVPDANEAARTDFEPDVIVADLLPPTEGPAILRQLLHLAERTHSRVIALTDDLALIARAPVPHVQILFRPCPPETLWDALAIAMVEREPSTSS